MVGTIVVGEINGGCGFVRDDDGVGEMRGNDVLLLELLLLLLVVVGGGRGRGIEFNDNGVAVVVAVVVVAVDDGGGVDGVMDKVLVK